MLDALSTLPHLSVYALSHISTSFHLFISLFLNLLFQYLFSSRVPNLLPCLPSLGLGNAFSTLAGPVLTALAFASHPLPALKELDMSDAKLLEARDMIDAAYRLRVLTELRVRRCPLFKADELRVYPRFINVYV